MQPITLEMMAFGPFAGHETIDFDALGERPLFLINGATGSGKSTILDALCFALYGETTGNERQGREMRCQFAAADTLTEVVLTFALGESRYRIRRIPEQERFKVRGSGTTRQPAEATLWRLTDTAEEVLAARKVSEATREIVSLTGLSAQQFRQVMVLPQGKFRELLLADSGSREQIFCRLFQTGVYARISEELVRRSQSLQGVITSSRDTQLGMLKAVDIESAEALKHAVDDAGSLLREVESEKSRSEKQREQQRRALDEARQLAKRFQELDLSVAELTTLEGQRPQFEASALQLANATLAREIAPLQEQMVTRVAELKQARNDLTLCRDTLEQAVQRVESAALVAADANSHKGSIDKLKLKISKLEGFRDRADQLSKAEERLGDAKGRAALREEVQSQAKEALARAAKEFAELQAEEQRLRRESERRPEIEAALPGLEKAWRDGLERMQIVQHIAGLEEDLKRVGAAHKRFTQNLVECCEKKEGLERAWQEGQAAVLARGLKSGDACPVCGSPEHPSPAPDREAVPDDALLAEAREEEKSAQTEREEAHRDLTRLQTELLHQEQRCDQIVLQLGSQRERSLAELEAAWKQQLAEVKRVEESAAGLEQCSHTVAQAMSVVESLEKDLESAGKSAEKAQKELTEAQTVERLKRSELPESLRTVGALQRERNAAAERLEELSEALERAERENHDSHRLHASAESAHGAAAKAHERAADRHQKAAKLFGQALTEHGMADERAFEEALMSREEQLAMEQGQHAFEESLTLARGTKEKLASALIDTPRPDVEYFEREDEAVAIALQKVSDALHRARSRSEHLNETRKALKREKKRERGLASKYAAVGRVSDVARGRNPHNMNLQRFVLTILLDDVLREAGVRLKAMSESRYLLHRCQEVGDRRRGAGLELEVEDAYSGKRRSVATLSGGESFMAALSLALGLSDVVQAFAGGIRLDALFIDEGFGSLDAQSLELAISTLVELQGSGRMVGLISHVAELKARIGTRIEVVGGVNGSSVKAVGTP